MIYVEKVFFTLFVRDKYMKLHRVWAVSYRHLSEFKRDFNRVSAVFYWPAIDILLFGYVSLWLAKSGASHAQEPLIILTNTVLWQVVNRAGLGLSLDFLEELWNKNISNIFASPLTIPEWLCGVILEGSLINLLLITYCGALVYAVYGVNILTLGWWLFISILLNFLTGFTMGLFSTSCILIWGRRVQSLVWMIGWGFSLISGAFYPIAILPHWLQVTANYFPLKSTFTSVRLVIETGEAPWGELTHGLMLNALYLAAGIMIFILAFNFSKRNSLERLCQR